MEGTRTAEDWMTKDVPVADANTKVSEVKRMVERRCGSFETIDYIYVLGDGGVLLGYVPIDKVINKKNQGVKIGKLIEEKCITVHPLTHQERVAYVALSHGLRSVPIVDKERRFLGAVTYDSILKIFNHEVHEDFLKFGGVFHKVGKEFTTVHSPARLMIKARLPWLLLGVFGGMIAASIVGSFEQMIMNLVAIAAFVPLLVYMSDAAGTQSETIIIRSMAIDPKFSAREYLIRELKIALVLGAVCGGVVCVLAYVGWANLMLGVIIGISLFASILASVFIATFLPIVLRWLGFDPAMAAGPFATIISDITTLVIYFMVAAFFINRFVGVEHVM